MSAGRGGRGTASGSHVELEARTAEETRRIGRRLGALLRAGDVVVLSGDLGAGKTTLTQGIGLELQVRGGVTSPTFVISRVHPSTVGGPALVHVDAYRLAGAAELDDLDLDQTLEQAVTVVEWGDGLAEPLAENRLRVRLERHRAAADQARDRLAGHGSADDEPRVITVEASGPRWDEVELSRRLAG
jgi:tRNA threonylcarbamoyladenosine biosynthesis protein TsaE